MNEYQKLGLKVWSTNINYVDDIVKLYVDGVYDFIELFVVPGSFAATIKLWAFIGIPFIIHAPHTPMGLNLSIKSLIRNNFKMSLEVFKFADVLNSKHIIFHPGIAGEIEETIRQLFVLYDDRMLIENKPYYSTTDQICIGYSPEEIKLIIDETGCGFCLDISHAICAANALKIKPLEYLDSFMKLHPTMYHVMDGDYNGIYDEHYNIGYGNYPLADIIKKIPKNAIITIETLKSSLTNLNDFKSDIDAYEKLCKERINVNDNNIYH